MNKLLPVLARAVLIVLLATFSSSAALVLRYTRPATKWSSEALPLGNGQLGCMVFGGVEEERIQFNEDSLWTGDENPSGEYDTMGAYQNFGDLLIELSAGGAGASAAAKSRSVAPPSKYERRLDLFDATAEVQFESSRILHRRELFASHPDGIIALRWSADRPGSISGRLRLQGAHGETTRNVPHGLAFTGKLSNGLNYAAQIYVVPQGGKVSETNGVIELRACDELVVLLAAGTSYAMDYEHHWRGTNPQARIQGTLESAAIKPWSVLRARHVADYQSLFGRVSAEWGQSAAEVAELPTGERLAAYRDGGADPELEALLFQYGRYLLISCSRAPGLPANLQGLWNDSNKPPWSSDYHSNINLQMNYWLAEPANLSECHLPFLNLVTAMLEPSRKATRAAFGNVRGWTARTSHNIFGGHGWQWNIPASAWYAQHFYEHFAFTCDTNYLRTTAYPVLKEICEFWEDHLKKLPDGTLVAPKGWSPEHGPREDGVMHDQQIIWDLFSNYMEAAAILGLDKSYTEKITDMRARLAGPKIGHWGQLQEWMSDRDDPKDQHRHTSHLFAVYPGHQISIAKTPDLAKAAAVSLAARGETGDSRRSWTWPWRCALWARLQRPEDAHRVVRGLLTYNLLPNLFANHPPFQMDGNFGITAGICEMLLQSHAGEIHLLPAVPKEWPGGSVKGLRARGGITVDLQWRNGILQQARLVPDRQVTATLRYGDRTLTRKFEAGKAVVVCPGDFAK